MADPRDYFNTADQAILGYEKGKQSGVDVNALTPFQRALYEGASAQTSANYGKTNSDYTDSQNAFSSQYTNNKLMSDINSISIPPGVSFEEWLKSPDGAKFSGYFKSNPALLQRVKDGFDRTQINAKANTPQGKLDAEIEAAYNSYKQPIFDAGGQIVDPTAKMLAQGAAGLGASAAYGAGGEGGMNGRVAAQAANSALVPYQQYRDQQANSMLGMQSSRQLGFAQLAELGRQFDAGAAFQDQANQYNANKGLGSTLGGVAGGIAGGLATIFTGGAAAPLIPALVSAGSGLGGSIAGAASGTPSSGGSYRKYGGGY